MSAITVTPPFPVFSDITGAPLQSGFVYVGAAGLNAESNQIPIFWDSALTIPALQPLRTLNGYISRNGSPAQVYANAVDYSLLVKSKTNALIWSTLKTSGISANAAGVIYEPSTGAATNVQDHLRAIDAYKNGANVVSVDMPPYNGNLSAALDAVPEGTVLLLGMRDYNIVGKYHSTPFTGPYVGNTKKHIKIIGAGMPSVAADGSRFISGSGTVIQGSLINYADGFEAYNLGVDVGSYVTSTYSFGGFIPEGFCPGMHRFQGTPSDYATYIQGVSFGNIKALAVSNFNHAILAEFINGLSHGYCEAIGGFHGYVCKSVNVEGGDVVAYGQTSDAYIIKSDEYTLAQHITLKSITIGKRGYPTRTAQGYIQSTNGGYTTAHINIGTILGFNCKELFTRIGDAAPITDVSIGHIEGDNISGNGFSILGDMRRVVIGSHNIANATVNGVYVDSSTGESIHIGNGFSTNSGTNGYYFDGPNHTHGNINAINNADKGVLRLNNANLDWDRVSGAGNGTGIISSLYEILAPANLLNGWGNSAGSWPFQVVKIGNVLHFRGSVRNGSSPVMAVLPTEYRPSLTLAMIGSAITAGGTRAFAQIDIQPNGEIQVANFAGGSPGLGGTGCVVALNFSYIL